MKRTKLTTRPVQNNPIHKHNIIITPYPLNNIIPHNCYPAFGFHCYPANTRFIVFALYHPLRYNHNMSKNLGNIPLQKLMSETQQQTFTNGINKGRKLTRSALHNKALQLLESYKETNSSLENPISDVPQTLQKFIDELFD